MAVLAIILSILLTITHSVSDTVGRTSSKIDAFGGARAAFGTITQRLGQATLNTFWDYDDPLAPTVYRRESNLQFLIRQNTQNPGYGQEIYFVSPQSYASDATLEGAENLLNACSFFVQFGGSAGFRPTSEGGKPQRYRYRLMQGMQPTDNLSIFNTTPPLPRQEPAWTNYFQSYWSSANWINAVSLSSPGSTSTDVTPLIDNVIACIFWPRMATADDPDGTALSANYSYDSKTGFATNPQPLTANQLPPTVQVTLILISEASAARLDTGSSTPPSAIQSALNGRFASTASFQSDLDAVSEALTDAGIEFQILNTTIALRESKWSDAN